MSMVRGNYMMSVPIRRLRHPLEESPLWGVLGSVFAGVLALVVGLPVLLAICILIPFCLLGRWLLLIIFWNQQTSAATQGGAPESVRGNDGRWLGSAWRYSVIHAVLIFEAGAGLDVTHLQNLLLTRVVPLYPRLTRRPVPLPLSAGAGHCWLPDSHFCIDRHVFAGPSKLTTEKQLQDYVGYLLGEGLSNDKPPWELHVLQSVGCHQDTVVVLRVHQSVADGMALVRVLCHSLADCQVLHVPQRPHFGALAFTLNIFRACLVGPLTLLFWLLLTTEDCNALTQRKGWAGQVSVTWSAAITLPKVNRIKQVTRSTVNCVLLSALAGAIRRLLQGCGVKQPPDLKIVLPVDLRADVTSPHQSSRLGSKVAPVVVGLPVSVEGAVPRLWAMRRNLDSLRTSADPVVVYVATAALMASVPGKVAREVLSSLTGKATLQFSSLPGPTSTLLVGGHPLKGVYPLLPAQNSLGLAVSVFTYADQVYVAIISDSTLGPAASTLLHHLHCQIELLWQLLLHRRVPGESRSHVVLRRTDVTGSPVRELRLRLTCVQEEVQRLQTCQSPSQQQNGQSSESSEMEQQDATHLQNLKTEFSELLSELHRRNSAAVGGNSPLFEDEEVGGELWRPRRRAMSCSSSRHSSRSLVGLLSTARPASFIESYSGRSPTNPSSPIAYRPTTSEHVLPGSTRPASYTDPHSNSSPIGQAVPLLCRAAASECTLPGTVSSISPEELLCNKDNPVSQIKHVPPTVSHLLHHSTFCSENITVISEHPSEVRNCEDNMSTLSVSTVKSCIKLNSSNIDTTSTVLQNKYLGNDRGIENCEAATEIEDITSSRGAEIDVHISSYISPNLSNSDGTTIIEIAQNPLTSHNVSQTSGVKSSIELNILSNDDMCYSTDLTRNQDKLSSNKSIIVTYPQYSPTISPEHNTVKYLKDSMKSIQSNGAQSMPTTNGKNNKGNTVIDIQEQQSCSDNTFAQHVSCNDLNAIRVIKSKYPRSATLKGQIDDKDKNSLVSDTVHSTDLTCNISPLTDTNVQYSPPCLHVKTENIQNQEPCSADATIGQTVIDSNVSTIRYLNSDIYMHLHKANVLHGQVNVESNSQKEVRHPTLNKTMNSASVSNTFHHSQNTGKPDIHSNQDCVATLARPYRQNCKTPQNSVTIDHCRSEEVPEAETCSVTPALTIQTDTVQSSSVLESVCSPLTPISNSTATGEQTTGYQIIESSDTSLTLSLVTSESTHSSISITSISSGNTMNSSSTFPPSAAGSPVHSDYTNKKD